MITAKRFNYIMCGILVLLIGASVALTFYANRWLTTKAQELVGLKLDTAALEAKQDMNQKAAEELEKYSGAANIVEKVVPKSKDQAKAVAELLEIGRENDFSINSITFPASDLGSTSQKPVAGTTGQATAAPSSSAISQAKPVEGIPNVLGIEVALGQFTGPDTISGNGISFTQLIGFLESIEKNRRTMQIKSLSVTPLTTTSGKLPGYSLTVTINIFVKP